MAAKQKSARDIGPDVHTADNTDRNAKCRVGNEKSEKSEKREKSKKQERMHLFFY